MSVTLLIVIILFNYLVGQMTNYLDFNRWKKILPDELSSVYSADEYKKSQQYHQVKSKNAFYAETCSLLMMIPLLFYGVFGQLDMFLNDALIPGIPSALAFFGIISLGSFLISLPFSLYRTFVIESKFGFNKTTVKLFISDKIKATVIGTVVGAILLGSFVYIYENAGAKFCVYTWLLIATFMLIANIIYVPVILPLFNKLKKLNDGELRTAIRNYCYQNEFPVNDIYIMDSSKRSTKANAFFSGLGPRKKIVLFDTLLDTHTVDEIVAILAHEIGHYKHKHTLKGLTLGLLQTALIIWLFSWFIENQYVATALGSNTNTIELSLFAFGIMYSPFSLLTGMLVNFYSRKHEYEADYYAASTEYGLELKSALLKLTTNNLGNPDPHPLTVFCQYSHPTVLHRIRYLDSLLELQTS
jgi:STE24 endopeptidase